MHDASPVFIDPSPNYFVDVTLELIKLSSHTKTDSTCLRERTQDYIVPKLEEARSIGSIPRNCKAEAGRFIITWSICSHGFAIGSTVCFNLFFAFPSTVLQSFPTPFSAFN